ncbi:MAG: TetR/AcrR family transcriptional regulator [Methanosarcinales archaeon]|nr:MAG: TetR/AcrR family transcriptional regulator [Methanosarcinales archaeon]
MQTLKKEVKERILKAARVEFRGHGFAKAKMRMIAERAGVSTGNLYTYFPNKDDLFCTLVKPAVDQINALTNYDRIQSENGCEDYTYEWHLDFYREIADVHYRNHEDLKLILFKSQGSRLENFREDCIRKLDETAPRDKCVLPNPEAGGRINEFLWHSLHSFAVNTFIEMTMHDLSREEMVQCAVDLATYMYYGWKAIEESRIKDFGRKTNNVHL